MCRGATGRLRAESGGVRLGERLLDGTPQDSWRSAVSNRPSDSYDRELLKTSDAERLLARASELDVARRAGSDVADLRAAASEAGISPQAFDAALAEMQRGRGGESIGVPILPSRRGRWRAIALIVFLVLGSSLWFLQRRANAIVVEAISARTVEESILLRCLAPSEAAELARPLLSEDWNTIVINPEAAPRRVTVRGRPAELAAVKAELAKHEAADAPACRAPTLAP